MSTRGVIHIVLNGHYLCNSAVKCDDVKIWDDRKMKEWLSNPKICKNCLRILNKVMETFNENE